MKLYKLTKTMLHDGHTSRVGVGESCTGYMAAYGRENQDFLKEAEAGELEVGYELCVIRNPLSFIKTSAIKDIQKTGDNVWTIDTQTSTYRLEELEDETDD